MDKSEQYIKMCDCPEIQKYRKGQKDFQIGDSIANYMLGKYSKANLQGIVTFEQHDEIRDRQLTVWLPRQDDIQGMIYENLARADAIVHDLNKWREKNYDYQLQLITMEQFSLAFYMYEKHGKTWDGKKWIIKEKEK